MDCKEISILAYAVLKGSTEHSNDKKMAIFLLSWNNVT